jgi:single-strand DNA-binding protein
MINRAILIGRAGKDPEIRSTPSGTTVANITLATSKKVKGEESTQWHRLVFFDKLAEVVQQYVRKGSLLYVEGEIRYGEYTDKDGVKRSTTDISVFQMQMLGGKPEQREEPRQQSAPVDEGDIPF